MVPLIPTLILILLGPIAAKQTLEVEFRGNESFRAGVLLAELEFWLEDLRADPLDVGAREDAAYELTQLYVEAGYPQATVTAEEPIENGDEVLVVFEIDEGPRETLGKIEFQGARHFDQETLRNAFEWERSGFFAIFGGGPIVFTEGVLEAGCVGIRLLYRLAGYRNVSTEPRVTRRETVDGIKVDVLIVIVEGQQFRVGKLSFDPTPPPVGLRAACEVDRGDEFTPRLPVEIARRVERFLADRGYFSARASVTPTFDAAAVVDLTVTYQPGVIARIGAIDLVGADRTRHGWVRGHLTFTPGDLFRKTEFEKSRSRLLQSGLFRSVRIVGSPDPEATDRLRVEVRVEEKDGIRGAIRFGFGSYELGRFGAELLHQNLFGRGIRGRLRGKVSFRGEEAEADVRFPVFAGRRVVFSVTGLYRRFEEPSFIRQESKGTVALQSPIAYDVRGRIGFELREEKVLDPEVTVSDELLDDSRSALLFVSFSRDTRDSLLIPTRGVFTQTRVEVADAALGSSLDFLRWTGRFATVWTPMDNIQLALGAQAGVIRPTESAEVPLGERFFLGGARSHRAFAESELGPKDAGGDPIGGEAYLLGNVELRAVIWRPFAASVFFDAGAVTNKVADLGREGDRYGLGGGLIWNTPIGPVRGDIGFNLARKSGEDRWVVHFLLGHPF